MEKFLSNLLGNNPGEGVIDLCLDHALIKEDHEPRFDAIAGLEAFPDLEELSISMHELASLQGLPTLQNLIRLNLSQNHLQDLKGFPVLEKLQFLDLSLNELQSLNGLLPMPTLKELHISFNQLPSLDHLPELPRLRVLTASGNRPLKDLRMLIQCEKLEELYLSNCYISDWEPVQELAQLQMLTASPANPLVLAPLNQSKSLKSLRLHAKRMGEIVYFPYLKGLKQLSIKGGSQVKRLKGLDKLEGLEEIELRKLGLKEVPEVAGNSLVSMDLSDNPIRSLKGLEAFPYLKKLGLGSTAVPKEELKAFEKRYPKVEIFWT